MINLRFRKSINKSKIWLKDTNFKWQGLPCNFHPPLSWDRSKQQKNGVINSNLHYLQLLPLYYYYCSLEEHSDAEFSTDSEQRLIINQSDKIDCEWDIWVSISITSQTSHCSHLIFRFPICAASNMKPTISGNITRYNTVKIHRWTKSRIILRQRFFFWLHMRWGKL